MNSTPDYMDFCVNSTSDTITPEIWLLEDRYRNGGLVLAVFKIVFILLGLPWNILVLFAIIKEHLYHQPTIILLMNLAIADLLIIVLVFPLEITIGIAGEYIFGSSDYVRCRFCTFAIVNTSFTLSSIFTISIMSFDRFIFIYKPLHYEKWITPTRTVVAVVIMWVLTIILSIFPAYKRNLIFYQPLASCIVDISLENSDFYFITLLLLLVGASIVLLIVCNVWVICIVLKNINAIYRTHKSMHTNGHGDHQDIRNVRKHHRRQLNQRQLHLFRVFGGLLISNLLTWLPTFIFFFLVFANTSYNFFWVSSHLLFNFQVFLHPLVETLLLKEVRDPIKKVVLCCRFNGSLISNSERVPAASNENTLSQCFSCRSLNFDDNTNTFWGKMFLLWNIFLHASVLPQDSSVSTEHPSKITECKQ